MTGNIDTYEALKEDIDICAAGLLTGEIKMAGMVDLLWDSVLRTCSGGKLLAEIAGHRGALFFNNQDPGKVVPYTF